MSQFKLEILTPEKRFFHGPVDCLTVETSEGQLGILAHHEPVVIGLQPANIRIKVDGQWKEAANGYGFVEVRPDRTVVLCETMEWPEEIILNRVQRIIEESNRKLRAEKSRIEYKINKAALARAFARMRLAKK
ncbi:MAG: ATP synthase F1 subunit epsilon [Clostridia bacterium]|nr:ATP synthase F1 subunit epsilon [Clostridia bacterium]